MARVSVSLSKKWERFLKRLADDHDVGLNQVVNGMHDWAFQDAESKEQFKAWLDEAPPEKERLKTSSEVEEEATEEEGEYEEESEEESHVHKDLNV